MTLAAASLPSLAGGGGERRAERRPAVVATSAMRSLVLCPAAACVQASSTAGPTLAAESLELRAIDYDKIY